jgi:putative transposase
VLTVVSQGDAGRVDAGSDRSVIDEIVREGARAMLAAALRAEVAAYVEAHADQVDQDGRRLVVRNGYAQPREVLTSSGAVEVVAPRVNDKRVDEATGERRRFASAILPPWCRKSPKVNEVLPLLYLHGLSSNDFGPALEQFFAARSRDGELDLDLGRLSAGEVTGFVLAECPATTSVRRWSSSWAPRPGRRACPGR